MRGAVTPSSLIEEEGAIDALRDTRRGEIQPRTSERALFSTRCGSRKFARGYPRRFELAYGPIRRDYLQIPPGATAIPIVEFADPHD